MESEKPTPPQVYERVLVPAVLRALSRSVVDLAAPHEGERVLDLACGTGIVARTVAPIVGAAGSVVGIDVLPPMLAVARSVPAPDGASIEWREGDATALDLSDSSFDLVICQQGLQFFPDREATASEVLRVLDPPAGGSSRRCGRGSIDSRSGRGSRRWKPPTWLPSA